MPYSESQRAYLVRDQMIGPFVINFGLNALIPWLMFRGQPAVPVWGPQSASGDLIATMFILPILVCLIATPLIRGLARAGKVPFASASEIPAGAMRLPGNLLVRALLVGLLTVLVLGPAIAGFFTLTGWTELGVLPFAVGKGVFCGLVAVVLSPPLALRAIADALAASPSATAS